MRQGSSKSLRLLLDFLDDGGAPVPANSVRVFRDEGTRNFCPFGASIFDDKERKTLFPINIVGGEKFQSFLASIPTPIRSQSRKKAPVGSLLCFFFFLGSLRFV